MKRKRCPDTTTLLPKRFVEDRLAGASAQSGAADQDARFRFRFDKRTLQRKTLRQQKRQLKKQRRAAHYQQHQNRQRSSVSGEPSKSTAVPDSRVSSNLSDSAVAAHTDSDAAVHSGASEESEEPEESEESEESASDAESQISNNDASGDEKDDPFADDVAYYGSRLKLKRGLGAAGLPAAFGDEGLADLLEGLDSSEEEPASESSESDEPEPEIEPETKPETAYVPPHLRAAAAASKQTTQATLDPRAAAQLLGALNRVTRDNVDVAVATISNVYAAHPRALVTERLSDRLVAILTDGGPHALGDAMVLAYAAIVGRVAAVAGVEAAAHFLQALVEQLIERSERPGDSSLDNVAGMLAQLYRAGVVGHVLVYDVIQKAVSRLSDADVAVLLRILRLAGPELRTDAPASLKTIVQLVTEARTAREARDGKLPPRVRFMVDMIFDLKNNRFKAAAGADDAQIVRSVRRTLRASGFEPLGATLDDIINVESRGKWWLVGSAWTGATAPDAPVKPVAPAEKTGETSSLMDAARKNGMNTVVRQSVFTTIMTSSDYLHAAEQLEKLGLAGAQARELVRVALSCCGRERTYNPYYEHLVAHLAEKDYSHKVTLRFALWDLVKELADAGAVAKPSALRRVRQLGRLFGRLVQRGVLTLAALRTVPFLTVSAGQACLLRAILGNLLLNTFYAPDDARPLAEIIQAAAAASRDAPAAASLRDGLVFFMYAHMVAGSDSVDAVLANVAPLGEFPTTGKEPRESVQKALEKQAAAARRLLEKEVARRPLQKRDAESESD